MVITMDGMDQAKTNLPHYARPSKLSGTEAQLKVRVLGAMVFGGPVPVIAFTSFDDVPSKGASAAMTYLERILDIEWEHMDTTKWDEFMKDGELLRPPVGFRVDEPDNEVDLPPPVDNEVDLPQRHGKRVPFMWP